MTFILASSPAYLPRAKVTIASIQKHHPKAKIQLITLNSEKTPGSYVEGLAKLRLQAAYDTLKKNQDDNVIIIGADCVLYDPLPAEYTSMSELYSIVLTPHVLVPPITKGAQLYKTGHANADLIGLSHSSIPILEWLLEQEMVDKSNEGIFYEQTWLSALPFINDNIHVCRDPGVNVAYFNLHERDLFNFRGMYFVNGEHPLVMAQFSGYELGHPETASKYYSGPALTGDALKLFKEYDEVIR